MASAQTHTVTGVVKDEKGAALPGVTIMVKGTTTGTTSMADGRYSVEVSPGNELEFSFLGYTSQTVRIASQTVIDIVLKESSLPGVSGLQTSGEPGHNDASIRIRGISTYGSANPLIVIDGVEQPSEQAMAELNAMDANEIQGISVLKDGKVIFTGDEPTGGTHMTLHRPPSMVFAAPTV